MKIAQRYLFFIMENMDDEIRKLRMKKIEVNTQILIDKFKPDVEKEGAKIYLEVPYGGIPQIRIKGTISDALTKKINAYASQFYNIDYLG
ncbi:MAG: hypothetical protein WKF91_05285 [Segetibacter sp.]